jgi:hypothetical protein
MFARAGYRDSIGEKNRKRIHAAKLQEGNRTPSIGRFVRFSSCLETEAGFSAIDLDIYSPFFTDVSVGSFNAISNSTKPTPG